jgi:DNA adenine methylase
MSRPTKLQKLTQSQNSFWANEIPNSSNDEMLPTLALVARLASIRGPIKSPFRWPGGKYYARSIILSYLPSGLAKYYCEPFLGGGSIFFANPLKSEVNVLADADPKLINCYLQIRDNVEALIGLLENITVSKTLQYYYKNKYQPSNDLERAFRYFYLNRISYGGIMTKGHCYYGYRADCSMPPEHWPSLLREASAKLQGVRIYCQDFEQTISAAPDGAVIFIDPPYWSNSSKRLYVHNFRTEDHRRLATVLQAHSDRLKFLLTYDDTPEIKELYNWTKQIKTESWRYNLNRTDYSAEAKKASRSEKSKNGNSNQSTTKPSATQKGKRTMGQELFITNYLPTSPRPTRATKQSMRTEALAQQRKFIEI